MRRTFFGYAATTKDAAQRSIRTFYEAVTIAPESIPEGSRYCETRLHGRYHLQGYWVDESSPNEHSIKATARKNFHDEEIKMKIKAVFHVDELEKWDLLITNVENLLKGIDIKDSQVEIVANSKAVMRYRKDFESDNTGLEELEKKGISVIACNNALNSLKIEKEMLYPYVKIVPIGVKEIIEKQLDGYAYVKP